MRPIEIPYEVISHFNGRPIIARAPVGMGSNKAPAMLIHDEDGRPSVMFLIAIEPAEAQVILESGRAIWLGIHAPEVPVFTIALSEVDVKFGEGD